MISFMRFAFEIQTTLKHSSMGLNIWFASYLILFISLEKCFNVAVNAGKFLEGEMLRITLSKPKNGNAQHLRVVSVVPLRSGFRPAIESLKEFYGERVG